jgi:hypothetical protein
MGECAVRVRITCLFVCFAYCRSTPKEKNLPHCTMPRLGTARWTPNVLRSLSSRSLPPSAQYLIWNPLPYHLLAADAHPTLAPYQQPFGTYHFLLRAPALTRTDTWLSCRMCVHTAREHSCPKHIKLKLSRRPSHHLRLLFWPDIFSTLFLGAHPSRQPSDNPIICTDLPFLLKPAAMETLHHNKPSKAVETHRAGVKTYQLHGARRSGDWNRSCTPL